MSPFSLRVFRPLSVFFALLLTAMVPFGAWAQSKTIVISQLYGAGGNTGAVLDSDFVELFNLGTTSVSLNGWSIQYLSATGTSDTSSTAYALPNITLAPGQYFLYKGATGTTCVTTGTTPATTCPTFTGDGTGSISSSTSPINLSGTGGKVFLVNTTTLLTGVTPTGASLLSSCTIPATVVDYVGFGTTATCAEGGKDTATPSAAQAVIRTNPCTDTDANGTDFSVGTPVPHNTSSTKNVCTTGPPTSPSFSLVKAPAQNSGSATLITAAVTPGTNPTSTGLTVTADLSSIGGSATQKLYDDGTNGDATANDGTYSYSYTIPANTATNTYTVNFEVSDGQMRSGSTSTTISVTKPVAYVAIHTIQGSMGTGTTAPAASSYTGQQVQTSGIVTGVLSYGFYIQAKDGAADSDPTTPEGIFVYTGAGNVPATATVGTEMQLQGTVAQAPSGVTLAGTQLNSPYAYSVLSTANTLPAAQVLTMTFPSMGGGPYQLMRYQSMRVSAPSFTVTEPTQGTLTETAETYASNGQFYGTVTTVPRPVRDPGLEILDPLSASYPAIAKFDDNPEVIAVDSLDMRGGSAGTIDVATGAVLTNMTGVMDFSGSEYNVEPGPQNGAGPVFMVDATTGPTVTAGVTAAAAVGAANAGELTVGNLSLQRFYNATADSAAPITLTSTVYLSRLAKASLAIRTVLKTPDILALQEVENLATLTDLSNQISADAIAAGQTDPTYVPYLVQGNDPNVLNVAFLVNPAKVDVTDVSQFGKSTTFTDSTGATATLNDHPPLVMHVGVKRAIPAEYPLTILVDHLVPLTGATANTSAGATLRIKREKQAEFLASLIQSYQAQGQHVISVGDYNAYDVNDGIADSMDVIMGNAVPAGADIVAGPATPLVTPALLDAAPTNVQNGAYSYIYVGNAESIDHFLVTSDLSTQVRVSPAHLNVDFPVIYRNDQTRPEVTSDHDGIVGYITIPPGTYISVTPASLSFPAQQPVGTPSASQAVTVKNTGAAAITFTSITPSTGFTQTNNCATSPLSGGASCTVNVVFQPVASGPTTGTLTFNDSDQTGTQTVQLTGTAVPIYSTILLSVTPSYAVAGANVALTATLGGNYTSLPAGTVTFYDNGVSIGTANVTAGVATLTTKTLAVGNHPITATYNGSAIYPTATTGASVLVTVAAAPVADFSFSVSNAAITVSDALPSGTATLNVAFLNGFSQTVSFSCTGLPANSHCNFAPATLAASGSSMLTVVIDKAALAPTGITPMERNGGIALGLGLLTLPLLRRRRALRSVMLGALLLGVLGAAISGCSSGTTTNKSVTTVVVTASAGSVSHTASFTLNVQ